MRAYKQFHDILHDLHDYGPQIDKAVAGLTRPPADGPSPQSVADTLDEWRTAARRSVGETEFPDHPPRWFKRFETAVAEVLAGLSTGVADAPQAEKVARAAQVLGNLPAEVQVELNEDLLNSALRLNTGLRTKRHWLGFYGIDTATHEERVTFIDRVHSEMARL